MTICSALHPDTLTNWSICRPPISRLLGGGEKKQKDATASHSLARKEEDTPPVNMESIYPTLLGRHVLTLGGP